MPAHSLAAVDESSHNLIGRTLGLHRHSAEPERLHAGRMGRIQKVAAIGRNDL